MLRGSCDSRTFDAFREPRIIFDVGGNHQLPAGRRLLVGVRRRVNQQGTQIRARGVDRRSQARGSRSDDHDLSAEFFVGQVVVFLLVLECAGWTAHVTPQVRSTKLKAASSRRTPKTVACNSVKGNQLAFSVARIV